MFRPEIRTGPKVYCGKTYLGFTRPTKDQERMVLRYCNKDRCHEGDCGYEERAESHITKGEN